MAGVFWPALRNDFIFFDDPAFVLDNPHVRDGLTWANVRWAFQRADVDYWRPVSWLSHMADCQVFGVAPWGHHLTSVLLHAFNALLVFAVWRKLTGAVWRSVVVAALFGLHPLHVESVAWVAERKDVLSTLFGLLALWAYAHRVQSPEAQRSPGRLWLGVSLGCFALALMSKPMLVTLPFVLLLLDYWPLHRFDGGRPRLATAWALVVEKIPFLALAAGIGVATVLAQGHVGALKTADAYPWAVRLANALLAYGGYLAKCVVPANLAVIYPYRFHPPVGATVLAGVLLAGLTLLVCLAARRRPYLPVGWFWFLGTLVPVIGLIQVGEQAMADRYTYVPLIGLFVIAAWLAGDMAARRPRARPGLTAVAAAAVLVCAGLASRQLGYWRDSTTLFRHAVAATKGNWAAHTYLGYALAKSPAQLAEAVAEYRTALRIAPGVAVTHDYLANALLQTPGGLPEAATEFREALRLNPDLADAHNNLGTILAKDPVRQADAIAEYRAALRLRPEFADVRYNLGLVLARTGAVPEAIAEYRAAAQLNPASAETHFALGVALAREPGRRLEAIAEYTTALRLRPSYLEAHFNLGLLLMEQADQRSVAAAHFREAVRIDPNFEPAQAMLARLASDSR